MDRMLIIWTVVIVLSLVLEGATAGLTSIWFAAGALAALILALISPELVALQIVIFIVVSIVSIILTRPLAKKFVNSKIKATNADRVIGENAIVTERIDNVAGTGTVTVGGRTWTARSKNGEIIEAGTLARVHEIEGVKLLVSLNKAQEPAQAAQGQ
ncbi:MAG: NfeD family protein [Clostridiales bacterium]|nr:NfeD family protein [Clostridiales bacterium]